MPFLFGQNSHGDDELSLGKNDSQLLSQITTRIGRSLELSEILTAAVAEVRLLANADRVKIYQFQPDGHGLVVAEALDPDRLPSLLNLHFPADDIPTFARDRYLKMRVRTIVDLEAQTIGTIPLETADRERLAADPDIRQIDPCHIEYLRAMGVKSSVVVPIAIEVSGGDNFAPLTAPTDREYLWGLLVCHHSERREVTTDELSLLQFVVDRLSEAITQSMLLQRVREQASQEANLNQITSLLYATNTVDLPAALTRTVEIFEGVGGRLYLPQPGSEEQPIQHRKQWAELYSCGTQPHALDDRYIEENLLWQKYLTSVSTTNRSPVVEPSDLTPAWSVEWMRANYALCQLEPETARAFNVWAVADIYREPLCRVLTPAFEGTNIRGLLIVPLQLGHESIGCLTIFRADIEKELVWAGTCNPDRRQMAPRTSFEAWRQIKSGQAQVWSEANLRLAQALGERFAAAVKQSRLYDRVQILNTSLNQQIAIRTAELEHAKTIGKQQQALASILSTLQQASAVENTIRTATQEVRQLLDIDRVSIYRFDENWGGQIIPEYDAVAPGWQQIVQTTDYTWNDDHLQRTQGGCYRDRQLSVVSDIYNANLSRCHIEVLESYYIRAFLVVPLFIGRELWGLLGMYHHSSPRPWSDSEVAFVKQIGAHLGAALQQAQSLEINETKASRIPVMEEQQQTLAGVISKIRESLDLERIFTATTEEVRRFLNADRVGIFYFDPNSNYHTGEFISEDVNPDYLSALAHKVTDTYFGDRYAHAYSGGKIQAVADIYNAGLQQCHIDILARFNVRANLIVPLLIKDNLWGLLCIHQCDAPRQWQEWEIDFIRQLAAHIGVALYQAKLLENARDAERLADQANRAKSEFLAVMSHELRTPLNAILGLSEGLQERIYGELTELQQSSISTIEQSGQHLLDLITEILDLAKIESGQLELHPVSKSVATLCNTSLDYVRQLAQSKNIQIVTQLPPEGECIIIDELRVRQMLINLLNNAVKFTPEGGCVTLMVEIDRDRSVVRFQVIDTGIGIAQENMPKLFQSFVQIDSSLSRQYNGTGLGLALVKRLVEAQNGDIRVTSTPGQGSCFTICLPYVPVCPLPSNLESESDSAVGEPSSATRLVSVANPTETTTDDCPPPESDRRVPAEIAEQLSPLVVAASLSPLPDDREPPALPANSRPEPTAPHHRQGRPRVLMVEDNQTNIDTFSLYLTHSGYDIIIAHNGREAIDRAIADRPDLILMDIQMPGIDGLEAIAQIRQMPELRELPIVALTALAMPGDREKCLAGGADEYLAKPAKLKELRETLDRLLTKARF